MSKYLFFFTAAFLLLFTQCHKDPKPETNVLVVTANGNTTKSNLSVSLKGHFDPDYEVNSTGSPYSISFDFPSGGGNSPATYTNGIGNAGYDMHITDNMGKQWYPYSGSITSHFNESTMGGFFWHSISISFTNLQLTNVYGRPLTPQDTIISASANIYCKN